MDVGITKDTPACDYATLHPDQAIFILQLINNAEYILGLEPPQRIVDFPDGARFKNMAETRAKARASIGKLRGECGITEHTEEKHLMGDNEFGEQRAAEVRSLLCALDNLFVMPCTLCGPGTCIC